MNYKISLIKRSLFVTIVATILAFISCRIGIASQIVNFLPDSSNLPFEGPNSVYDYYCRQSLNNEAFEDAEIVVINVADYPRSIIGQTINIIEEAGAKVVGVDIVFPKKEENDANNLLGALSLYDNLVISLGFVLTENKTTKLYGSYFMRDSSFTNHFKGVEAITNESNQGRSIETSFEINRIHYDSFSWAIAKKYNPSLKEISFCGKYINYKDFRYDPHTTAYDAMDIINNSDTGFWEDFKKVCNNKIVLIGGVNDYEDLHYLPTGDYAPGILCLCYAISSIIHNAQIINISSWIIWLISVIICFLITLLFFRIRDGKNPYVSWILKGIEIAFMFIIVSFCLALFKHNLFVDFTPYFTTFAFQLFLSSIPFKTKEK